MLKFLTPFRSPVFTYQIVAARSFASRTGLTDIVSESKRKSVTVLNDNGLVPWNKLSRKEKVARTTQQTFYVGIILCGATLSGGLAYLLYDELFSPENKISLFNRVFDRVKRDERCISLLGDADCMKAYGDPAPNSWRRTRPLVSSFDTDQDGTKHFRIKFNVEGTKGKGCIYAHMIKRTRDSQFSIKFIVLDVDGNPRIDLENADKNKFHSSKFKLFGVSWR